MLIMGLAFDTTYIYSSPTFIMQVSSIKYLNFMFKKIKHSLSGT